jgi:hypothetical protein
VNPHYRVGETPGWDITSYDEDGNERYIEVKSTIADSMTSLELTPNEWEAAQCPKYRDRYWLYLVTGVFSRKQCVEKMVDTCGWVKNQGLSIVPSMYQLSLVVEQ